MENRLLVFISSLIGEMALERKAVKEALETIPLTRPWVFEYTPASADLLEASYLNKVRECDIFILLLAENISAPVRKEWECAVACGKPRLVFLKKTERSPEAQAFIRDIDVKWAEFAFIEELQRQVLEAVADELIKGYRRYRLRSDDLEGLGDFLGKLRQGRVKVGGDYIEATIGDQAHMVAVGKDITQISHETSFHGPVYGPVHTGSGDIHVEQSAYATDEESLARLRAGLIASVDVTRYPALAFIIARLKAGQIREVGELLAALEKTQLSQSEIARFLTTLSPALAEAREKGVLPADTPDITDASAWPDLAPAHRLKLALPLISFLLGYEGELHLENRVNLEMAWAWLKEKLGRA